MRYSPFFLTLFAAAILLAGTAAFASGAFAQQLAAVAAAEKETPCPSEEPDTVQISWTQPCDEGGWLLDTQAGCRMWDWHPDPDDKAAWTGACKAGVKDGKGVVQWFEHGQPIDRFEGKYSAGKREGQGRYEWNDNERFVGSYANDVPHGFGTLVVLGETWSGDWRNGCLAKGDKVIAIGVPRASCGAATAQASETIAGF
jgi:hypothetical protein